MGTEYDKVKIMSIYEYLKKRFPNYRYEYLMETAENILSLMGGNELGDSGVTGEHGVFERPLPSIPDDEKAILDALTNYQICYKSNKVCRHNCGGLCKNSM